jgi:hypothetical protein
LKGKKRQTSLIEVEKKRTPIKRKQKNMNEDSNKRAKRKYQKIRMLVTTNRETLEIIFLKQKKNNNNKK